MSKDKPFVYTNLNDIMWTEEGTAWRLPKHFLAPKSPFRMLVVGPTGCSKTNHVVDLLFNYLSFDRLFLYAADLCEPKYQFIIKRFEDYEKQTGEKILYYTNKLSKLVPLLEVDNNYHNLIIFDDFVAVKDQQMISDYFLMGQRRSCDMICWKTNNSRFIPHQQIYISQSYMKTPKLIHDQMNYYLLFSPLNGRDLENFWQDIVLEDMLLEDFRRAYAMATSSPPGFLVIDCNSKGSHNPYRYWQGWDRDCTITTMLDHSFYLTFNSANHTNGTSDDFTTYFNPPLTIDSAENYEIALCSFRGWYTWRNIEAQYDNIVFYYNNGSVDQTINIPAGFYGIEDLNTFIQAQMRAAGDYSTSTGPNGADEYYVTIIANYQLNRAQLVISGGYSVDLTQNALAQWLGFDPAVYSADTTVQNNVLINNGITDILINVDIVQNSLADGSPTSAIHTFLPVVLPSYFINETPSARIYLPLLKKVINHVRIQITDNLRRRINFNGEPTSIILHLRWLKNNYV